MEFFDWEALAEEEAAKSNKVEGSAGNALEQQPAKQVKTCVECEDGVEEVLAQGGMIQREQRDEKPAQAIAAEDLTATLDAMIAAGMSRTPREGAPQLQAARASRAPQECLDDPYSELRDSVCGFWPWCTLCSQWSTVDHLHGNRHMRRVRMREIQQATSAHPTDRAAAHEEEKKLETSKGFTELEPLWDVSPPWCTNSALVERFRRSFVEAKECPEKLFDMRWGRSHPDVAAGNKLDETTESVLLAMLAQHEIIKDACTLDFVGTIDRTWVLERVGDQFEEERLEDVIEEYWIDLLLRTEGPTGASATGASETGDNVQCFQCPRTDTGLWGEQPVDIWLKVTFATTDMDMQLIAKELWGIARESNQGTVVLRPELFAKHFDADFRAQGESKQVPRKLGQADPCGTAGRSGTAASSSAPAECVGGRYAEIRDYNGEPWPWCTLCGKWSTVEHLHGKDHVKKTKLQPPANPVAGLQLQPPADTALASEPPWAKSAEEGRNASGSLPEKKRLQVASMWNLAI